MSYDCPPHALNQPPTTLGTHGERRCASVDSSPWRCWSQWSPHAMLLGTGHAAALHPTNVSPEPERARGDGLQPCTGTRSTNSPPRRGTCSPHPLPRVPHGAQPSSHEPLVSPPHPCGANARSARARALGPPAGATHTHGGALASYSSASALPVNVGDESR